MAKKKKAGPKPKTSKSKRKPSRAKPAAPTLFDRDEVRKAYAKAVRVLRAKWRQLHKQYNTCGLDVGLELVDKQPTGRFAIRFHFPQKRAKSRIRPHDLVPASIDGVPTDVIERSFSSTVSPELGAMPMARQIGAGAQIAPEHAPGNLGTLGLVVQHALGTRLLTCAHVVAGGADPSVIDSSPKVLSAASGQPIGTAMSGRGVNWEWDGPVDCALLDPLVPVDPSIPGIVGPITFGALREQDKFVIPRIVLVKFGAMTGMTTGHIESVFSPLIIMQDGTFTANQIQVSHTDGQSPFAVRGDSGAPLLRGNEVVGLIRGVDSGGFAIACHMNRVAALLSIHM